jgi:2,5-diamino-6-(ribosylamino)-4(3H)-pyrimidinone 5'-phosphate reductase
LYVVISAAMSLDGKIATNSGESNISSTQDLERVHKLRGSVDAIMVGILTVIRDDPMLNVRYAKGNTKLPLRVILDSKASIPLSSRILKTAHNITTIVAVTRKASAKKIRRIENTGAHVLVAGNDRVDISALFRYLDQIGCTRILVEGGGETNWSLLNLGLIDEIIITVSSMIIGGRNAVTLVEGCGYTKISDTRKLKLIKFERQGPDELVLYYRSA